MNTSVAIQILPLVNDDQEVVKIVDHAIQYIQSTGVNYQVGPFETTLEGDYDQLMEIVKQITKIAGDFGHREIMSYVKINYQPKGSVLKIDEKTKKYEH